MNRLKAKEKEIIKDHFNAILFKKTLPKNKTINTFEKYEENRERTKVLPINFHQTTYQNTFEH